VQGDHEEGVEYVKVHPTQPRVTGADGCASCPRAGGMACT
jgi:hypothetical protein